jgi:hypothetical protein
VPAPWLVSSRPRLWPSSTTLLRPKSWRARGPRVNSQRRAGAEAGRGRAAPRRAALRAALVDAWARARTAASLCLPAADARDWFTPHPEAAGPQGGNLKSRMLPTQHARASASHGRRAPGRTLNLTHRQLGLAHGVEQDVGRLEVHVDDAAGRLVEVGQPSHDLRRDRARLALREHLHAAAAWPRASRSG